MSISKVYEKSNDAETSIRQANEFISAQALQALFFWRIFQHAVIQKLHVYIYINLYVHSWTKEREKREMRERGWGR